ncbi:hypothetical protein ACHAW6_000713, partial [Cyclotella cf. meneghiniana]
MPNLSTRWRDKAPGRRMLKLLMLGLNPAYATFQLGVLNNTTIGTHAQNAIKQGHSINHRELNTCSAKKIKIESTTGEQIQFYEVLAFTPSGMNVALGGFASQSSVLNNKSNFEASKAIDAIISTFSHTNDPNPWWMVELTASTSIESVLILNRYCG